MAATTRIRPPSGRSVANPTCPDSRMLNPAMTSTSATAIRTTRALRRFCDVSASSGSASWRSRTCSSADAFRQISTSPAALMTMAQA